MEQGQTSLLRGRESLVTKVPIIGGKGIAVSREQARHHPEIQSVLAKFALDGWQLVDVYPAEPGMQLVLQRPCC
jgi:hypothetical protein